jgi:hypothetical protein
MTDTTDPVAVPTARKKRAHLPAEREMALALMRAHKRICDLEKALRSVTIQCHTTSHGPKEYHDTSTPCPAVIRIRALIDGNDD